MNKFQLVLLATVLGSFACNQTLSVPESELLSAQEPPSNSSAQVKLMSHDVLDVSTELYSVFGDSFGAGLGFFIQLESGQKVMIFQSYDDPVNASPVILGDDIGNVLKAAMDVVKGGGSLSVAQYTSDQMYAATLTDLGSAHFRMNSTEQLDLATRMKSEQIAAGKSSEAVAVVAKKDLNITHAELSFPCSNITNIGNVTQTTGGSVNIFEIQMSDGNNLQVNTVVGRTGALESIMSMKDYLQSECMNHDKRTIFVTWHIFQQDIYTNLGTYHGFITNPDSITVKDDDCGCFEDPTNTTDPLITL